MKSSKPPVISHRFPYSPCCARPVERSTHKIDRARAVASRALTKTASAKWTDNGGVNTYIIFSLVNLSSFDSLESLGSLSFSGLDILEA